MDYQKTFENEGSMDDIFNISYEQKEQENQILKKVLVSERDDPVEYAIFDFNDLDSAEKDLAIGSMTLINLSQSDLDEWLKPELNGLNDTTTTTTETTNKASSTNNTGQADICLQHVTPPPSYSHSSPSASGTATHSTSLQLIFDRSSIHVQNEVEVNGEHDEPIETQQASSPKSSKYSCPDCSMSYEMKHTLTKHQKRHEYGGDLICMDKNCGYKSYCKRNVIYHNQAKHIPRDQWTMPFHCEYDGCDQVFSSKPHLTQHISLRHKKIKDFQCEKCDKIFTTTSNKNRHFSICHLYLRNFVCGICDHRCTNWITLANHVKQLHHETYDAYPFHEDILEQIKNADDNYLSVRLKGKRKRLPSSRTRTAATIQNP